MRKKRGNLMLAVTAVAVLVLSLAACSSDSSNDKTSSGATKIVFWQQQFEPYQQTWFKKYVDKYNKSQKKVFIDYKVVPADAWVQKLKAAQAAGNQPDVQTTNYGAIPAGVADGQFASLDGLIPASKFTDIKSNVSSFVQVKGKHYAYPMLVEPSTVLYYRTDLVKAAGLDPNSPPKTWDDLVSWSKALTKGKTKGMTIASTALDLQWSSWGLQRNACGHWPISDDWSKAEATDPCFAKVADLYKQLYQGKYMPQTPKVGYADSQPYAKGDVAMMACGSWAVGQLRSGAPKILAKTKVAPFPSIDGDASKPTATLGGWTLTVDSKSNDKKAAAGFINYLLAGDPNIMKDFFTISGYSKYTVRTSVDDALKSDPKASNDPFMKIISDQVVAHGVQEPTYPADINMAMGKAIEAAMKGQSSPDSALKTANNTINDVISRQKLAGTGPGK